MIELGALLGAILMAHAVSAYVLSSAYGGPEDLAFIFLLAPSIGAVWGAAIAGIIHFTADGTALRVLAGAVGLFAGELMHHPH